MRFLDTLDPTSRTRLESTSELRALQAGDWLVRAGDPGGDIYVIEEGALEVLEARPEGEEVIAHLGEGDIVGELAFLDDSPRSADVRCQVPVRARRWTREDLHEMVQQDPKLAARVYEALARTVAARLRNMAQSQQRTRPRVEPRMGDAQRWTTLIREAGERVKSQMEQAHLQIRRHQDVPKARQAIDRTLHELQDALEHAKASRPDAKTTESEMRRLRRELRPWMSGSWLAMRLIDAPESAVVQGDVFDHVIDGLPKGEGGIGTHVERWLIHTPSMVSRRATEIAMVHRLATLCPTNAIWLDTPSPGRMRRLGSFLAPHNTHILLVDGSQAALAIAREALEAEGLPRVTTVHETPLRLALGRSEEYLPKHQVVVLGGLLVYMPDRLAVPTLALAARLLPPGGRVLLDLPAVSSPDDALWSDLFRWPLIRRSPSRVQRLVERAGLRLVHRHRTDAPGDVLELTTD